MPAENNNYLLNWSAGTHYRLALYAISKMRDLPYNIKEIFFKRLRGDIPLDEFERWAIESKSLESSLDFDDYIEIISFDYRKKGARYEIDNLIKKIVDIGEFERYKMLDLLNDAKLKDDRLPTILKEFFNLYNSGYRFLQDLGLGLGLMMIVPPAKYSCNKWEDLKEAEKRELVNNLPRIDEVVQRTIDWLVENKIVLTGEQNEVGRYLYLDRRTEEEKKPLLWTIEFDESDNYEISLKSFADRIRKKWWAV